MTTTARGRAVVVLGEQIADELAVGAVVPCVSLPADWTTDDDDAEARYLARACGGCPVLAGCRTYLEQYPEPSGAWAGMTARQRRETRTMTNETTNDDGGIGEDERELVRLAVGVTGALLAGDRAGADYLLASLRAADAAFVIASQASLVGLALDLPAGTSPEAFIRAAGRTLAGGAP